MHRQLCCPEASLISIDWNSLNTYLYILIIFEIFSWNTLFGSKTAHWGLLQYETRPKFIWTHFPWTKWPPFCRRYFQMHFREWKVFYFDKSSLKVFCKGPIGNNAALVKIMAWHRIGDKPLSEPILTLFITTFAALGGDELNSNSTQTRSSIPSERAIELFLKFVQGTAVSLTCTLQIVQTIWRLTWLFGKKKTVREIWVWCVSDEYPILQQLPKI